MKKFLIMVVVFSTNFAFCQESEVKEEKVWDTFEGTRVLNNHSAEMLYKRQMEFIIAHKFGDMAGPGAFSRAFGLDNLADVRIGFEYGITNNLNIGLARNKGFGAITQLIDGYAKYRILHQSNLNPLSLVFVSSFGLPYAAASTTVTAENAYPDFTSRFIYTHQLIATRKFSDRLSLQLNAGVNHRNFVAYNDVNTLVFVGGAARVRVTQIIGLLAEYNHILNRGDAIDFQNPLTFGLELLTGGHTFTFMFSNSQGVNENLFIPSTTSNWLDGEFRLGFSITRKFKI
ncbi:MAG: DUF5777 family beta-barrel protein [Crocinitomicaceae bacterium]